MKFLDEIGLAKLWGLITNKFATKDESVSIDKLVAGETNTKIPSSLLPSYVDDVLEYDNLNSFPASGESGKIYVDLNTNKTYRWSGSSYVEISASLALGETSETAYRGDYGAAAYEHASNKGSAFSEGLYKITTNDEGHVTSVSAVQQNDITNLGIATTATATLSSSGLMSAADKAKLDTISESAGDTEEVYIDTENPGTENTYKLWIDSDSDDSIEIPEINDTIVSLEDTWSSKKISGMRAYNLLDNSDFRHPVNQRGMTSNTKSAEYMIDRWKAEAASNVAGLVQIVSGGIVLSPTDSNYCGIYQLLEHYSELSGKTVTLAVCADGVWYTAAFTMGATPSGGVLLSNGMRIYSSSGQHVLIRNPAGNTPVTLSCAALYEGSYTDDTVPAYQPRGYAAELAECMRYYQQTWDSNNTPANQSGTIYSQAYTEDRLTAARHIVPMRTIPTITFYAAGDTATEGAVKRVTTPWTMTTGISTINSTKMGFVPRSSTDVLVVGEWYGYHYSASADL